MPPQPVKRRGWQLLLRRSSAAPSFFNLYLPCSLMHPLTISLMLF